MRDLFGTVGVTPEVLAEVLGERLGSDQSRVRQALSEGWLRPLGPTPKKPVYPPTGQVAGDEDPIGYEALGNLVFDMLDDLLQQAFLGGPVLSQVKIGTVQKSHDDASPVVIL
jgi:hypothetical protein